MKEKRDGHTPATAHRADYSVVMIVQNLGLSEKIQESYFKLGHDAKQRTKSGRRPNKKGMPQHPS